MQIRITDQLDSVPAAHWNALVGDGNPFLRHEFLTALEHHQCVGPSYGWLPHHILVHNDQQRLIGATPFYIKDNSYGEFVFDWSWADAYERAGLPYYPKGVISIPYTPATGPRLLVAGGDREQSTREILLRTLIELAQSKRLSSLHCLFTNTDDSAFLSDQGLLLRLGCQFHWENRGYRDFDDFLEAFNARKRKKLRRERRRVQEANVEIRVLHGDEADDEQWRMAHHFYRSTFEKKWGVPTLNLGFFQEIARTMGKQIVLVFAYHRGQPVAGAINLRGSDSLYGRHWGCTARFHSLHFEICYYQGIAYCIQNGLRYFEPGAQGEHKISRGFLPTPTWSAHWIADDRFRGVIEDFLRRETRAMRDYIETLHDSSPFRRPDAPTLFPGQADTT